MTVIEKQYMESVININRMMRKAQDAEPDWEQRRYEIAKNIIVTYSSGCALDDEDLEIASALAVKTADALIEELKKSE